MFGAVKKNEAMEEHIKFIKLNQDNNYKVAATKALNDARSNLDVLLKLKQIKEKEFSYYNDILNELSTKMRG